MKNVLLFSRIANIYLKVRYNLFKKWLKKKDFSDRKLLFSDDFKNLDNFEIKDNEFYNDHLIWFSKDAVKLTDEGVSIVCYKDNQTRTTWQGTRNCKWTTGMITTYKKIQFSKGVWVITAKPSDCWPAIWLLKYDRKEPGYDRNQITPEIDIMETMRHREIRHTVHYGYSDVVYRRYGIGSDVYRNDNKFHEFAVELLDNGYKFYVDGILTARFKTKNPEFVTNYPNYLLLNNAAHTNSTKDTDFVVKSVKFYE